jgi:hypothetical protein
VREEDGSPIVLAAPVKTLVNIVAKFGEKPHALTRDAVDKRTITFVEEGDQVGILRGRPTNVAVPEQVAQVVADAALRPADDANNLVGR